MEINYFDSLTRMNPAYYDNIVEMNELMLSEDTLYRTAVDVFNMVHQGQYIPTMSIDFIKGMEQMLGIVSNINESLDFRRSRVLNRLSVKVPFNLDFLRRKLDTIYGEGNYVLTIEEGEFQINLETTAIDSNWYKEGYLTIQQMKPANMVYIHKPLLFENLLISENIYKADGKRFQLGVSKVGIDSLLNLGEYQEVTTV